MFNHLVTLLRAASRALFNAHVAEERHVARNAVRAALRARFARRPDLAAYVLSSATSVVEGAIKAAGHDVYADVADVTLAAEEALADAR